MQVDREVSIIRDDAVHQSLATLARRLSDIDDDARFSMEFEIRISLIRDIDLDLITDSWVINPLGPVFSYKLSVNQSEVW